MFKPINGWTKARILEVIQARPKDEAAYDKGRNQCMYLTPDGNKCAVGLFIPDGHPAQAHAASIHRVLHSSSGHGLKDVLPLELEGLGLLQTVHDNEAPDTLTPKFNGNAKAAMLHWVTKNVQDDAT